MPEPTDARYPFALLTGRGSVQPVAHADAHRRSRRCCASCTRSEPYVEINPADARALGVEPQRVGDRRVAARAACGRARIPTYVVQPGQLFIPMHYAETNRLTFASFDPYSRQPSYKHCAVRVKRETESPSQT